MSPRAYITVRMTKSGRRYVVRYRWGGRGFPVVHLASLTRRAEALELRDWAAGTLASGKDPREELAKLQAERSARKATETLPKLAERYAASRIDVDESTRASYPKHAAKIHEAAERLGLPVEPRLWDVTAMQQIVAELARQMKPRSVDKYFGTVKLALDFAGVEPNPARDRRVRMPAVAEDEPVPPTGAHVLAILERVPPWHVLADVTMEQTAVRVGETELLWGDVDVAGSRFRIRAREAKSRRAKWVPVPRWLMELIAETCAPEDRDEKRRVFPVTHNALRRGIARACRHAAIPHYSPHDFRHRRISLWHQGGTPTRTIMEWVGHRLSQTTLDTYSHVMPLDEIEPDVFLELVGRRGAVEALSRRPREAPVRSRQLDREAQPHG